VRNRASRDPPAPTEPARRRLAGALPTTSGYDSIARLYDDWSRSVTEDVSFYVAAARASAPGPVVELGVGTGRIAVPIALAGIPVVGIDSSRGMLEVCGERAALAGVSDLVDLRFGDFLAPPVRSRVPLVLCPFRSFLHLADDGERLTALRAARSLLRPGGRLIFDVFAPSRRDIDETHGRWLEREPGIFERADWDERARTLTLAVRGGSGETTMALAWLAPDEWEALIEAAGFAVEHRYGWFDGSPDDGGEDVIWVARRASR
jgi:SAM-dependent methyltransferase